MTKARNSATAQFGSPAEVVGHGGHGEMSMPGVVGDMRKPVPGRGDLRGRDRVEDPIGPDVFGAGLIGWWAADRSRFRRRRRGPALDQRRAT